MNFGLIVQFTVAGRTDGNRFFGLDLYPGGLAQKSIESFGWKNRAGCGLALSRTGPRKQLFGNARSLAIQSGSRGRTRGLFIIRPQDMPGPGIHQEDSSPSKTRVEARVGCGRIAVIGIVVARVSFVELPLECFAEPVGQNGIGGLRIGNHLHHVIARQPFGQVLIETPGHGHHVNGAGAGCLRSAGRLRKYVRRK